MLYTLFPSTKTGCHVRYVEAVVSTQSTGGEKTRDTPKPTTMADLVQRKMENMIPELEELMTMGIFTKEEVKVIVEKRRDFEYLIGRKGKELSDFLSYIQYEIRLDLLKKKRVRRLGINRKMMNHVWDGSKHIQNLFYTALNRYPGDVRLWLQFLDYQIRSGGTVSVSKTLISALKLHPHNSSLWILAANWEYTTHLNISSARGLFHRAIRLNKTSLLLYYEYCRLELMYLDKFRTREALIAKFSGKNVHEPRKSGEGEEKDDGEEREGEEVEAGEEEKEGVTGSGSRGIQLELLPEEEKEEGNKMFESSQLSKLEDEFLSGEMGRIVFRSAIKAVSNDLECYVKFSAIFRKFPDSKKSLDEVYSRIVEDFPENPDAISFLALRPMHDFYEMKQKELHEEEKQKAREEEEESDEDTLGPTEMVWREVDVSVLAEHVTAMEETISNYLGAIQSHSHPKLKVAFLEFLTSQYPLVKENVLTSSTINDHITNMATSFCTGKEGVKHYDPSYVLMLSHALLTTNQVSICLQCLEVGTTLFPTSSVLWSQRFKLMEIFKCSTEVVPLDPSSIHALYSRALSLAPTLSLYKDVLTVMVANYSTTNFESVLSIYKKALYGEFPLSAIAAFKEEIFDIFLKNLQNPEEISQIAD
eukprot:TRINITY_DN8648_c0_g2_i5.p1 TRINITY_DN8648_c0_g2~~TRINITY_DN8648_c0_g2_i5.p1  ORF type:complete len:646 (+),score=173.90 TRINITY_DN8648_c0_g2_i5:3-1940(+)